MMMPDCAAPSSKRSDRASRDHGTILVLTLVLTIVLSLVVLALASYATTGLKTSEVTTKRTESNSVASAGLAWYIEELAANRINPEDDADIYCDDPPGLMTAVPPQVLPSNGLKVEITCTLLPEIDFIDNHPTVQLNAVGQTTDGTQRTIDVIAQVARDPHTVQIYTWTAD